jgi:hypothetical protein
MKWESGWEVPLASRYDLSKINSKPKKCREWQGVTLDYPWSGIVQKIFETGFD